MPEEEKKCECCGSIMFQEGTEYKMCCNIDDLSILGPGYSLYYLLIKHVIWKLLILTILVSIPCIAVAAVQINGEEYLAFLKE